MLRVLQRSQQIYDASRREQLREISECVAVIPEVSPRSARSRKKKGDDATARSAKSTSRKKKEDDATARSAKSSKKKDDEASDVGKDKDTIPKGTQQTPAEKQLEVSLSNWNAAITRLRSSIKMEEVEIVCGDEKKKLWKVQRPKIETLETLDQLQLIPDNVFKRILTYIPRSQLPELCKVNKYWASVIEDLKAEEAARLKISIELEKLRELKLAQPSSTQLGRASPVWRSDSRLLVTPSQCGALMRDRAFERERVVAEREEDIGEVLNIRGAMDKDMFHWCEAVIKLTEEDQYKNCKNDDSIEEVLGHLPSPLIEKHRNVAIPHLAHPYPAYKIVAHESPI
ncbi:hypothetical protein JYU34_012416 [Plutella xylostella]|nr:hypothetical protein JYU34_012416 [Plutella xylostella]